MENDLHPHSPEPRTTRAGDECVDVGCRHAGGAGGLWLGLGPRLAARRRPPTGAVRLGEAELQVAPSRGRLLEARPAGVHLLTAAGRGHRPPASLTSAVAGPGSRGGGPALHPDILQGGGRDDERRSDPRGPASRRADRRPCGRSQTADRTRARSGGLSSIRTATRTKSWITPNRQLRLSAAERRVARTPWGVDPPCGGAPTGLTAWFANAPRRRENSLQHPRTKTPK